MMYAINDPANELSVLATAVRETADALLKLEEIAGSGPAELALYEKARENLQALLEYSALDKIQNRAAAAYLEMQRGSEGQSIGGPLRPMGIVPLAPASGPGVLVCPDHKISYNANGGRCPRCTTLGLGA